jgi:hypothetical protein
MGKLRYLPFFCLVALILFFALRHSSNPAEITWLPDWLKTGGDSADSWRNFGAFFLLTASGVVAFPRYWRLILVGVSLLVVGLEAGQNLIPDRWLEFSDIVEGLAGVGLAGFLYYLFRPKSDIP